VDLPTDQTNLGSGPVPIESHQQRLFSSASPRFRRHLDLPHPHNINSRPRATTCATTLVFMILLISTADPDNAHTSTNDQKVGHHSTHPLPYTPSTRVCLWQASTLDSRKHFTCTASFGLEFGHWESTHGFSRHLLFRALYPTSRARGGMHSGRLLCAWRSTVRQLCYFLLFPRASLAAKVTLV
jgi:hypothetical protein